MKSLFTPYNLAGRRLANHIAMAPMTRSRTPDTIPHEDTALYYAQRAGAGLIVSECIAVSPEAMSSIATPGLWTQDQIRGWKKVTDAVHKEDGVIFAQIWHAGRASHSDIQPGKAAPVSSTDKTLKDDLFRVVTGLENGQPKIVSPSQPRGLKTEEMPRISREFAQAAENAIRAGFDGVEIHGANGYLFEQFLNPNINDRSDCYGGSVENRVRFLVETLQAVADRVGPSRVGVRLSPFSTRLDNPHYESIAETYILLGRALSRMGLAYVHFNSEMLPSGERAIPESFLRLFRAAFSGTIILAGSLDRAEAERLMSQGGGFVGGLIDIASFGRPFIANPDLVERLRNGWPLAIADPAVFFGGGSKGYTDFKPYEVPVDPAKAEGPATALGRRAEQLRRAAHRVEERRRREARAASAAPSAPAAPPALTARPTPEALPAPKPAVAKKPEPVKVAAVKAPEPPKAVPAKPEPVKVAAVKAPEPPKAAPVKPEPVKPAAVKAPEPPKAVPAKPEPVKAEVKAPEPPKAVPAKPEPVKPAEVKAPEPPKAVPVKPEPVKAEVKAAVATPEPQKVESVKPDPQNVDSKPVEAPKPAVAPSQPPKAPDPVVLKPAVSPRLVPESVRPASREVPFVAGMVPPAGMPAAPAPRVPVAPAAPAAPKSGKSGKAAKGGKSGRKK
ncbi:hypothetical protein [Phaeovibrio sulfidiphilus]|uniref:oxidoreductase n=1 Tax=Phaeovibrio sulfidiphilus TaxID=1220600 RepID=UPI0018D8A13B|nr:hypothetical protein [Phaeovibrio sulfidiphilus]